MEQRKVNPWTWHGPVRLLAGDRGHVGAERVLYCAGQTSTAPDGSTVAPGDMSAQTEKALDNLETVLRQRTRARQRRPSQLLRHRHGALLRRGCARDRRTPGGRGLQPAGTLLGVTRLAFPDLLIEIEATAVG